MASESEHSLSQAFELYFQMSESIQYAVVDGFVGENCKGNPAAVVLLSEWKDDKWMQDVAVEFNLSATAYLLKREKTPEMEEQIVDSKDSSALTREPQHEIHEYDLRWFTPEYEVNLYGIGTFATTLLLYHTGPVSEKDTILHTKGGLLSTRCGGSKESNAQTDSSEGTKAPKEELLE